MACPNRRRGPEHDAEDFLVPGYPEFSGARHPMSTTKLLLRTGRKEWPHSGGCGRRFAILPTKGPT